MEEKELMDIIVNYEMTGEWHPCFDNEFAPSNIGQGDGYKSKKSWEELTLDEVCYIPEQGYEREEVPEGKPNKGVVRKYPVCCYSKRDFLCMCNDKDRLAKCLYQDVNYQRPEALLDEWPDDAEGPEDLYLN